MKRRTFLATTGAATATAVAGCSAEEVNGDDSGGDDASGDTVGDVEDDEVLEVATYSSFVDAPSDSPGVWIAEEFEERYDVEFEWHTPEQELTYYVERHNEGAEIEPELYLGMSPHDLVSADQALDGDLFVETDTDALEQHADLDAEYEFDPYDRVIPTYRSYCGIVYDGRDEDDGGPGFDGPETLEDLTNSEYEGQIGVSNPAEGTTGSLFMLWSIDRFGEDGYLDYWNDLLDNDAHIAGSWSDLYAQFEADEIPLVVSYANDRVFAKRDGADLDKHQVALPHGESYANVSGMARFAEGTNDELAHDFMDFVLSPEVQAVIAERNVTGPVNTETELPEVYEEYAEEPEDTVFFDYEALDENYSTWIEDWEREIAGGY